MVARVQNAGLAWITSLLAAAAWWLQWGIGSAAATTANLITTTITTEARASATPSQTTGTVASDTVWVVVSYKYGRFRSCPEVIQCR